MMRQEGIVRAAGGVLLVAGLLGPGFVGDGLAAPTTRPGWPVVIQTPGAGALATPNVQFLDLWGDGNRFAVTCWFAYTSWEPAPGVCEFRQGDGTLRSRIEFERISRPPSFVDVDDDGIYEVVAGRGNGIAMFDAAGGLIWNRARISGDPVWRHLTLIETSIGDLDGDGRQWIVAFGQGGGMYVLDLEGNPRPGWPIAVAGLTDSSPALADLDGDGRLSIITGDQNGRIRCYEPDGSVCSGWHYEFHAGEFVPFDLNSPIVTRLPDDQVAVAAISGVGLFPQVPPTLHLIDGSGGAFPGFPLAIPSLASYGESLTIAEALGTLVAAMGGRLVGGNSYSHHLVDLGSGEALPGWPFNDPLQSTCSPAVGQIGQSGPVGFLFGGGYSGMQVKGYDWSGVPLPGYPRTIPTSDFVDTVALGTLDGVETTACWTTGANSSSSRVDCFDLGVPWSRDNVQWGNYGFDLQHTSRFRRLWQIDRARTDLTLSSVEVPSDSGSLVRVTVKPRRPDGSSLGEDQQIRLGRLPKLGRFVGPLTYEPATGDYWRLFEPPVQDGTADIEFRVLVNEELDDTRRTLRLVGKPKITSVDPIAVVRGGAAWTPVTLRGVEFGGSPTVLADTSGLLVGTVTPVSNGQLRVDLRATGDAAVGWSGVAVRRPDGRVSNFAPIFVYDRDDLVILASEGAGGAADLDWFGAGGPPGKMWTLERSPEPGFRSPTVIYNGPRNEATDTDSASPVWFYRVR